MVQTGYEMFRGKCRSISEEECKKDKSLRLVRGFYHDPLWGKQMHWWCVDTDGKIVDKTKSQFPSNGMGEYEEFNGIIACSNCGIEKKESEYYRFTGRYAFCSSECEFHFVMG